MNQFGLLAGALVVTAALAAFPAPAAAKLGAPLEPSIKQARAHKRDLMGVVYFLKGGKVIKESWNSEMAGWPLKTADRYRALLAGGKKLKTRATNNRGTLFTYADGTKIQYNESRGVVITIDALAPGYAIADEGAGKYEQVADWKEAPWKGRAWK